LEDVMKDRGDGLAPLLGVAFVVLLVAGILLGGTQPAGGASAAKVVSFYSSHRSQVQIAGYLMGVTLVVGLFFFGYLRDRLADGSSSLAATAFGGAVLFAVGGALSGGMQLALSDVPGRLSPGAAQALNLVNTYVQEIAVHAGPAVLLIASGLAILQGARLPRWTGQLALVLGVLSIPALVGVGPIPAGIWTLIISIVLFGGRAEVVATSRPATPPPVASGAR
jgi:hypothetical protein